ncbi:MAG TPA: Sua5/YciO/YrdC/YwlC family protein, partial [bacterium]|nr:Sua5/YciO/YrdC/YwlC family protein [bacterium]
LGSRYWPGPLTLILPGARNLPEEISGAGNTVGVRIPDEPFLLSILQMLRGSVAAPSANLPGEPPVRNAQESKKAFGDAIDLFVEGGPPVREVHSTVVSCVESPAEILREGAIELTSSDLES